MKFTIGYQCPESGERFTDIVADYRAHIDEVYFAWPGVPSGRPESDLVLPDGPQAALRMLEEDIEELRRMGVKLDLLLNANCHGAEAMSVTLEKRVCSLLAHLESLCGGVEYVTAASPAVAQIVKKNFPAIKTRASVNMRIGTPQAMSYAAEWFDSFCLQRDVQRNFGIVKRAHDWCGRHGKQLCLLVNSGCLRFCPAQVFHDNAVAHDAEIDHAATVPGVHPYACWSLFREQKHLVEFLKATWIRPEDLPRYEGLADLFKLATRRHSHPRMVLEAYTSGGYRGDLMNLMEPGYAPAFAPRYIDNARFPDDWAERMARCDGDCGECDYCETVLEQTESNY